MPARRAQGFDMHGTDEAGAYDGAGRHTPLLIFGLFHHKGHKEHKERPLWLPL